MYKLHKFMEARGVSVFDMCSTDGVVTEMAGLLFDEETREMVKENLATVFLTWQLTSQMASVNRMGGGKSFPPPFDQVARSMEDLTSLEFFNMLHVSCTIGRGTHHGHRVSTAALLPVLAVMINLIVFACFKKKPSIGEKVAGRAMSAEMEQRGQ